VYRTEHIEAHRNQTEEERPILMDDLIEALQILRKYGNPEWPTHCEHDELSIMDIKSADVSLEHKEKLDKLGFFISADDDGVDCFKSFRFGSA